MEPVVSFREAVCLLGRFPALAGVDLDVGAGEIVLLQGPNGAGKTTVLRACAGLVPVVYGDVAFDAIRGGTIISTEEIMEYFSAELSAAWL